MTAECRLSRRWFEQSPNGFGNDFAIFKYCLATEDGPPDFACQLASDIGTVPMAIKQTLGRHFERLPEVYQSEIGIRPERDPAFLWWKPEPIGDIGRRQPND